MHGFLAALAASSGVIVVIVCPWPWVLPAAGSLAILAAYHGYHATLAEWIDPYFDAILDREFDADDEDLPAEYFEGSGDYGRFKVYPAESEEQRAKSQIPALRSPPSALGSPLGSPPPRSSA